jgi:hypothetical protein
MPEELHVVPDVSRGGWVVAASAAPPTWFATVGEAEKAAAATGIPSIYVHDRYHRVRALAVR